MPKMTDGLLPLDDGFTVHRLEWQKSPLYRLVKDGTNVAWFDCLQAALAAYRAIRRISVQPTKSQLETIRRIGSYVKEWE